jgi:hypothetical protein
MFEDDPIYSQADRSTGMQGWFFNTREGEMGPFLSKEKAKMARQEHLDYCIKHSIDGGRTTGTTNSKLSLEPLYTHPVNDRADKKLK